MNLGIKHKQDWHNISKEGYQKKTTSNMRSKPEKLLHNLFKSHGISIDIIDEYSSRFNAVPVGTQFNKAKSNILLSKSSSKAAGYLVFVDNDLKYLGKDTTLIKALTGSCVRNWRRLSINTITGSINQAFCKVLEILESTITHEVRLIVDSIGEKHLKVSNDPSDSILTGFGEIISPEILEHAYQKTFHKELATEIAIIISRTESPNSVLLWGEPGVGKDLLMLSAAHPLLQKNRNVRVVKISGWKVSIGSMFPTEIDNSLNQILTEAQKQNCLLLIQDIDVCLSGTKVGHALLCDAIDNGLHFIASVRNSASATHLAKDKSIVRRLIAVKVEEPSFEDILRVLRQISQRSPVKVQPSAIQAILSLSQRELTNGGEPASSIGLLSAAISQAEWKKTQVDPDLVYSMIKGQWPEI